MTADLGAPGLPPELHEVLEYRRAARAIIRDETTPNDERVLAVVSLVERGRRDAQLPQWVQEAVWRESRHFLETGRWGESVTVNPMIGALRRLRRAGLERCESCFRTLPDEGTLDRWEALAWTDLVQQNFEEAAV